MKVPSSVLRRLSERKAEDRLEQFYYQAVHTFDSASILPNWHIGAIADSYQNVIDGHVQYQVIMGPPRNGKTGITSVCGCPWGWLKKPGMKFLYASHDVDLAREHSRHSRLILESEWYRDRWGDRFKIEKRHELLLTNDCHGARGVRPIGSTTGFGANVFTVDDPHDADKVSTPGDRKKVVSWFRNLITRLNNPKEDKIVVVGQRVNPLDLIGFITEQLMEMGFEILCLPLEYNPKHKFVWQRDPRTIPGEPLHPEREGPEEIKKKKIQLGSRRSAAQLGLQPLDEKGGSFKNALWQYVDRPPILAMSVRFWDFATTDPILQETDWDPDYSAGVRVGMDSDGRVFVEDSHAGQWISSKQQEHVTNTAREMDGRDVEIVIEQETAASGKGQITWYAKHLRGYAVKGWPVGNIHTDAESLIGLAEIGMVYIVRGHWNTRFLDVVKAWPHGRHTDEAVAFIGAYARLVEKMEERLPKGQEVTEEALQQ